MNEVSSILIGRGDENEKKADQFASYFLIPSSSLYQMIEEIKIKENENNLRLVDIIKLEPQELISPLDISAKKLESMDKAVENFKLGQVSNDIDLSEFL